MSTILTDTAAPSDFFIAGAALQPDAPSYIERPADNELFNLTLARQFCYVFAASGTGKSSLAVYTSRRLEEQGFSTAVISLAGLDIEGGLDRWYLGLIKRLAEQLQLSVEPDSWWEQQSSSKPRQRFVSFVRDVVLVEVGGPVAVFVDEIEAIAGQEVAEDFLATIRSLYDGRTTNSAYDRLTFVLLGVAEPDDFLKETRLSPFAIGQGISLDDFSRQEAQVLYQGLEALYPQQAEALFDRLFYWTRGHPYLSQKLCRLLAGSGDHGWSENRSLEWVDWLTETTFLRPEAALEEPHFQTILNFIQNHPSQRRLLTLYHNVFIGKNVPDLESSAEHRALKLSGLVRAENNQLKVRNEIYRRLFNLEWTQQEEETATKWVRPVAAILIVIVFFLAGFLAFYFYGRQNQVSGDEAQALINDFQNAAGPVERLVDLAALFKLPGYEQQAQRLFYESLTHDERLTLFGLDSPQEVEEPLVTVVRGVYTAAELVDEPANNALLETMAQALHQLNYSSALNVVDLELEITQWLRGRKFRAQGQYRQALDAFDYAITLNDRNPGPYFDRALTYLERGEAGLALADLAVAVNLNAAWQPQVQQVLLSNQTIYDTLWAQGGYQALAMLVPTPTVTPTPSATITPSPTPSLTPTPAPPSPTPTVSTPVPTATPAFISLPPTETPTVVPTPTEIVISAADLVLLQPLSLDHPSYGPTTFEWQWNHDLPSGYGFEVRVWRADEFPAGVHNAVLDNQNGVVKSMGSGKHRLSVDIRDAAGVKGRSGEYLWTVALVKIEPEYTDLGEQAEPARMRFEAGGSSGGGGGKSGNSDGGSGNVGIE